MLRPRDVVRLEVFGVLDGYHAGVCRTAVVGEAPPEVERVYRGLVDCRRAVLQAIHPLASSTDVYRRFLERFEGLGHRPIPFVGHGIDLRPHEEPYLGPTGDMPLEAGMVLGIEPLVYGTGFGLQIKDTVALGPSGVEVMSAATPVDQPVMVPA